MLPNFRIIDLTHSLDQHIPIWPGSERWQTTVTKDYPQGCKVQKFSFTAGMGTHMDAPAHFAAQGRTIDQFDLTELFAPACVIDIREQVMADCDYALTRKDLTDWEKQYGAIPPKATVLAHTGWSSRWHDEQRYRNADKQGIFRFPGFSLDAACYCLERNIAGIGIDTYSPDPGQQTNFPVHHLVLNEDKFQLENLTNLDLLPASGAFIFALPMKIKGATEAPIRALAFIPF